MLLAPVGAEAYSFTLDEEGADLHWTPDGPRGRPWLPLVGNASNSSGLDEEEVRASVVRALQRWSRVTDGALDFDYWQGTDPSVYVPDQAYDGLCSVFFASARPDGPRVAPMVAGHTQVWFDPDTGRILEADILLNDIDWTFTTVPSEAAYGGGHGGTLLLDDVLTHELGHAWGLGHSGLVAATMFSAAWAGQATPSCDDVAALRALYGLGGGTGAVAGVVEGPRGRLGRVQVTAISRARGVPLASGVTAADGRFTIQGLPPGDYHLLIEPFRGSVEAVDTSSACHGGQLARRLVGPAHALQTVQVVPGVEADVGRLQAACTPDGAADVPPLPGQVPVLARGVARVAAVDAVPRQGTRTWRLEDVDGTFTVTAVAWSLFSPVRASLRVLDAAGREVQPRLSLLPRWEDGETGQSLWDARLVVTLPARGDYLLEVATQPLSPYAWPMGERHVDDGAFVVLLADPEEHELLGDPTACAAVEPLPTYRSPDTPPFRRDLEASVDTTRLAGCGPSGCGQGRPTAAIWTLVGPLLALTRRRRR